MIYDVSQVIFIELLLFIELIKGINQQIFLFYVLRKDITKKLCEKLVLNNLCKKMGLEDNEGRKKETRTRKKTQFERVNN